MTRRQGASGASRHGAWAQQCARSAAAMLAVVILLAGCDGPGVVSPGSVRVALVGSGSGAQDIAGTWRRAIFFVDEVGIARSTETTWQFGADGSVVRMQVARNLTFGLTDVLVSIGRYRLENAQVIIDFVTPTSSRLAFEIRRSGDQLSIAGETYLRAEG